MNRIVYPTLLALSLTITACGGDGRISTELAKLTAPVVPPTDAPAPEKPVASSLPMQPVADPAPARPVASPPPPVQPVADPQPPKPASMPSNPPVPGNGGSRNSQQEVLNLVNQARANSRMCGTTFFDAAGELQWNEKLFNAAFSHSTDMATNNFFSHTGANGSSLGERVSKAGYKWSSLGENIAAGYPTADSVIQGWLNSPGHCANLMKANATELGVANVRSETANFGMYWTLVIARPQ